MANNQEIMLEWKEEPSSPNGGPLFLFEDEWLNFDDGPADLDINTKNTTQEKNPSRAQIASELLDQLESGVEWRIKEEPFQDWLEEKIEIPIFEDLVAGESVTLNDNCVSTSYSTVYKPGVDQPYRYQLQPEQVQHHVHLHGKDQHLAPQQQLPESTQSLLQEFETILGDVEACHQSVSSTSTLTPPQSPPPVGRILFAVEPIQQQQNAQYIRQVPIYEYGQYQPPQQVANIVFQQRLQQQQQQQQQQQHQQHQSLQIDNDSTNIQIDLDNSVQVQNQWGAEKLSIDSLLVPSSPNDNRVSPTSQTEPLEINHYIRSYNEDALPSSPFASSSENGSFEDSSEDLDWSSDGYSRITEFKKSSSNSSTSGNYRAARRHRPYARPSPEDKRVRKKEQNKNAATRYRQKKKQEIKEIVSEEQELVLRNEKLNTKVSDLQREIGYLKGLMRDLCKAKGLIK